MKTIIVGAGRLGSQFAAVLASAGNTVTIVDLDEEPLAQLTQHAQVRTVVGDACEPYILEEAGALAADLLVASTGEDEDNLVISLLAKRQFHVPRVVARINDDDNAWLFDQKWGVDVPVPAAGPLISLIEEATGVTDTVDLLRLGKAGVSLIETVIGAGSKAAGRRLGDLPLPAGTLVATVIRAGTSSDADDTTTSKPARTWPEAGEAAPSPILRTLPLAGLPGCAGVGRGLPPAFAQAASFSVRPCAPAVQIGESVLGAPERGQGGELVGGEGVVVGEEVEDEPVAGGDAGCVSVWAVVGGGSRLAVSRTGRPLAVTRFGRIRRAADFGPPGCGRRAGRVWGV
jgi:trk/ktr system potassium uptake protein